MIPRTTTANLPPAFISDDLHSSFYNGGGLPVRVVTAGKLPQSSLFRPLSFMWPGSDKVVTSGHLNNFERGPKRVVTILKPDEKITLLWAFKQDVSSDKKGEPDDNTFKPGSSKKITDPDLLREKRVEQEPRMVSAFINRQVHTEKPTYTLN